jgi:O-antigen/teichoic acid export membrane protein
LLGPFIARTLLPLMARMQGERARMASAYLRAMSLLSFAAAVTFALLAGAADPLLLALLGPGWEPSVPALRVFAALGILLAAGNALGSLALALGRADTNFWINAAILIARAGAVAIGARSLSDGVTGAALGMLAVTVASLPLDFILPKRWLGVEPGVLARAAGWALLPAALTVGAMTALTTWMRLPAIAETLIAGIVGVVLFLVTAWALQRQRLATSLRELRQTLFLRR